jgi:hypothetical protein
MFGIAIYLVVLPILTFIPCPFGVGACTFSDSGMPFFERPDQFLWELLASPFLFTCIVLGILATCLFNISGNAITKYINALARTICDISRTAFVWIFAIIITIVLGDDHPNYRWEILDIGGILMEAVGFVVLIAGNLIYNEIVSVPFIGADLTFSGSKTDVLNEEHDYEDDDGEVGQ